MILWFVMIRNTLQILFNTLFLFHHKLIVFTESNSSNYVPLFKGKKREASVKHSAALAAVLFMSIGSRF